MTSTFFQYLFAGISQGSLYALLAVGMVIVYNTTGLINFAHGEFMVLGALISSTLAVFLPIPLAIIIGVIFTAIFSGIIEIIFLRKFKNFNVLKMIIITIGISILLKDVFHHIWGTDYYSLPYFTGDKGTSFSLFGAYFSPQVLWVIAMATLSIIILSIFFKKSKTGLAMRAASLNPRAARLCGISTSRMITLSFIISGALAATAGAFISPISGICFDSGSYLSVKAFAAAIIGGLGSFYGAVIGGIIIGVLESFSLYILPANYIDIIATSSILIILFFKPAGLFNKKILQNLKEF